MNKKKKAEIIEWAKEGLTVLLAFAAAVPLQPAAQDQTQAPAQAPDKKPAEDAAAREWLMEQENIFEQLNHLLTYPYIYERYSNGTLGVSGWHYIIETGEIYIYDDHSGQFLLHE